jgi:hypothetical protein
MKEINPGIIERFQHKESHPNGRYSMTILGGTIQAKNSRSTGKMAN